ncbi:hypothetical protein DFJ74DRAFT_669076 [Hyaloraphidium curvatum]|nr:hypothetical protein DFJ74DRAFT_669076 [Hyaloraphidium curvatum]
MLLARRRGMVTGLVVGAAVASNHAEKKQEQAYMAQQQQQMAAQQQQQAYQAGVAAGAGGGAPQQPQQAYYAEQPAAPRAAPAPAPAPQVVAVAPPPMPHTQGPPQQPQKPSLPAGWIRQQDPSSGEYFFVGGCSTSRDPAPQVADPDARHQREPPHGHLVRPARLVLPPAPRPAAAGPRHAQGLVRPARPHQRVPVLRQHARRAPARSVGAPGGRAPRAVKIPRFLFVQEEEIR